MTQPGVWREVGAGDSSMKLLCSGREGVIGRRKWLGGVPEP